MFITVFTRPHNLSRPQPVESISRHPTFNPLATNVIYRVIQEESAILWEMIVCVILSKKVHINMYPIFDGYGVMGIF